MFKRIVWMGVGAAAGSASTVWAQRKVKTQIERASEKFAPSNAGKVVADRVRDAVAEGRAVMVETEADLRGRIDRRPRSEAATPMRR